jgi:hypothetical protein
MLPQLNECSYVPEDPKQDKFCASMKWLHIRSAVHIYKGIKLKSKLQHTGSQSVAAVSLPSLVLSLSSIFPTPSSHYAFDRARKCRRSFQICYLIYSSFCKCVSEIAWPENAQVGEGLYCPDSIYPVYLFRTKIAFQLINPLNTNFLLFTEPVFRERTEFPVFPPMLYSADETITMTGNSSDRIYMLCAVQCYSCELANRHTSIHRITWKNTLEWLDV